MLFIWIFMEDPLSSDKKGAGIIIPSNPCNHGEVVNYPIIRPNIANKIKDWAVTFKHICEESALNFNIERSNILSQKPTKTIKRQKMDGENKENSKNRKNNFVLK